MLKILLKLAQKYKRYVKFVVSGITATLTHFVILFTLTELGLWYVASASIGFVFAFLVSFHMQKFWTFRDASRERMMKQMMIYFTVAASGMALNASGMYALVEYFGLYYLLAQVVMSVFIAVGNYLMYRFVIFNKHEEVLSNNSGHKPKKILIATGIFPPDIGGPATYVKTLVEELPRRGYEVTVVTYTDKFEVRSDKLEVIRILRKQNIILRYLKYFRAVWSEAREADIVYVQDTVSAGLPTCLACYLRGQHFILKVVGDYAWEQGQQKYGVKDNLDEFQKKKYGWKVELWRRIQKGVAKQAKLIITPSEYLRAIVETWDLDGGKIKVIYNAVKTPRVEKSHEELKAELGIHGFTILTVGRLVPWKGMDVLINAMSELKDIRLIIVGEGPEREKLEVISNKLEVNDRVIFTGRLNQERLWEHMKACDLFVLNTGYEGLPHVTIEAMMLGLPVITTRVGGNPEVVRHNENGILVEYNNKEEIKGAILKLKEGEGLRERLSSEARMIKEKFNKDKMIERLIHIFNKYLS